MIVPSSAPLSACYLKLTANEMVWKSSCIKNSIRSPISDSQMLQVFLDKVKGRCVRTLQPIECGADVVRYSGELLNYSEAKRRERICNKDPELYGSYMFFFRVNGKANRPFRNHQFACIDATKEPDDPADNLGRLLNHSCSPNLKPVSILMDGSGAGAQCSWLWLP